MKFLVGDLTRSREELLHNLEGTFINIFCPIAIYAHHSNAGQAVTSSVGTRYLKSRYISCKKRLQMACKNGFHIAYWLVPERKCSTTAWRENLQKEKNDRVFLYNHASSHSKHNSKRLFKHVEVQYFPSYCILETLPVLIFLTNATWIKMSLTPFHEERTKSASDMDQVNWQNGFPSGDSEADWELRIHFRQQWTTS